MTEPKKKRGRPRKIEPFNPSNLQKEVDEVFDAPRLPAKIKDESANTAVPYPKDWASMGKVDRLAWLTANPR